MFYRFRLEMVDVGLGSLQVPSGGDGPALLLLHGYPGTHMTWRSVADLLAPHFHVVCPDLRGFGKSFQPADAFVSYGSSKRAKTADNVELMRRLGYDKSSVVGDAEVSLPSASPWITRRRSSAISLLTAYPSLSTWNALIGNSPAIGSIGSSMRSPRSRSV